MTAEQIVILILSLISVALGICTLILAVSRKKLIRRHPDSSYAEKVRVRNGIRYSSDDAVEKDGEISVSHAEGDILLMRGVTYTAERGGKLMPGSYTVLASEESAPTLKLRIGGCAPVRTAILSCSVKARRSARYHVQSY